MRSFQKLSLTTVLIASVMALAGCAMMSTDVRIDAVTKDGHVTANAVAYNATADQNAATCRTYAGSYALPKTYVRVTVEELDTDPLTAAELAAAKKLDPSFKHDPRYEIKTIDLVRREDPRHTYCLDYITSLTGDDRIQVVKAQRLADDTATTVDGLKFEKTNLLESVATDGIDRSRVIIEDLVDTIFTGLAQEGRNQNLRGGFAVKDGDQKIALQLEFDPFDPKATARANRSLRRFGFCVVLAGYSFNWNEADINWYCKDPTQFSVGQYEPKVDGRSFVKMMEEYDKAVPAIRRRDKSWWPVQHADKLGKGILYRPTLSYPLYVFGNKLPNKQSSGWKFRVKLEAQLENISPIIAVDIERPFFNQRKTKLTFKGGILKDVCIYKTSELLEIVQIPFVVVNAISALPTEIIQLRLSDVNNDRQLADVENRLLKAQLDYLNELQNPTAAPDSSTISEIERGPSEAFQPDNRTLTRHPKGFSHPDREDNAATDRCKITTIAEADKKP